MAERPGEEIDALDEALVFLLKGLAMAIPRFAEWLFSREDDPVVRRVRDILPEKSRSREAQERLEREIADEQAGER